RALPSFPTRRSMSMINYASREINCKLVYYGPGLGGKTTNLEHIYGKVSPNTRGKMISLAIETERTLFFDFLPVDLGTVGVFKTLFHLYTVPAPPGECPVARAGGQWGDRAGYHEAVALRGDGVFDTLKAVSKMVLKTLS